MKHARDDYDRIQDPAGLIGEDEPVFLLRAKDLLAPSIVALWAELAAEAGVDPKMVEMARGHAAVMAAWQRHHQPKIPDLPTDHTA